MTPFANLAENIDELWHRPASECGRLRQVAGGHPRGDRRRGVSSEEALRLEHAHGAPADEPLSLPNHPGGLARS